MAGGIYGPQKDWDPMSNEFGNMFLGGGISRFGPRGLPGGRVRPPSQRPKLKPDQKRSKPLKLPPPQSAPRNKQGGLLPSAPRGLINHPPQSRQQRRAVDRLEEGRTHPKVLKEAQESGAKAFENKKPIKLNNGKPIHPDPAKARAMAGSDFRYQAEMAREGAIYKHIVRGASQSRLDAPRQKLSLDPPSTIVNIDRGTIASRRGGEFARRRHEAETEHNKTKIREAAEHAMVRLPGTQGRSRDHQPGVTRITDSIQGKAKKFAHNQLKGFSGGDHPPPGFGPFPEMYAVARGMSRHIGKVPNTVPLVRTQYGQDRVGGRGIPRDLGPAIDKSMGGYWLGLVGAVGVAGVAEAMNNSRKRGIGMGRYASSAASSLPPYGGRR